MATNLLAPVARQRIATDLGVVAPGALLYTLVSGSPSTPLATTSDAAGTVPNANPIVASAGGLFGPIYLTPGVAYHFRLTEASGVPIWDQDPVQIGLGGTVDGNLAITGSLTVAGSGSFIAALPGGIFPLRVQNTSPAAGSVTEVSVGNDIDGRLFLIDTYASGYASTGFSVANGTLLYQGGAGGLCYVCAVAAPHRFFTSSLERMRITPTGELLINTPTNGPSGQLYIEANLAVLQGYVIKNTSAANVGTFLMMLNSVSTICGLITQNGATGVTYATSSDARLKDDDGPATDLAALRGLVIHDFTWKADGVRDRGVFAQEAHTHLPRAIIPGTDETTEAGTLARPWMTDYSKLVPDLVVGWQQHDAAIAALEAAVAALTGSA
jgi:hypothetical protein